MNEATFRRLRAEAKKAFDSTDHVGRAMAEAALNSGTDGEGAAHAILFLGEYLTLVREQLRQITDLLEKATVDTGPSEPVPGFQRNNSVFTL